MKELDAKDYGYFTISKDNYESEEDFWKAVTDALRVLTDNDNQVLFEYGDCGNYIVQYVKPKFGAGKFVMVTDEDDYSPVIQSIDCYDCTNFDRSTLKCCNEQCENYDALNSHIQNLKNEEDNNEDYGASQETYETEHIGYEDTEEPNTYFEE